MSLGAGLGPVFTVLFTMTAVWLGPSTDRTLLSISLARMRGVDLARLEDHDPLEVVVQDGLARIFHHGDRKSVV